jgi:hypothetical protein
MKQHWRYRRCQKSVIARDLRSHEGGFVRASFQWPTIASVHRLVDAICLDKSNSAAQRLHGLVTRAFRHFRVPLKDIFKALKRGECLFGNNCPFAFCKFHHRASFRTSSATEHRHCSAAGESSTGVMSVLPASLEVAGRALVPLRNAVSAWISSKIFTPTIRHVPGRNASSVSTHMYSLWGLLPAFTFLYLLAIVSLTWWIDYRCRSL